LFNLFVHWEEGGFDSLAYVIEKERFGEYTSEKLLKRFIGLLGLPLNANPDAIGQTIHHNGQPATIVVMALVQIAF
jgi:hypothetical protein